MYTLGGLLTECAYQTSDDSAKAKTNAIRRLNDIHRMYCASEDYYWLEDVYTTVTVNGQQSYNFAINHRKVKTVKVTIGNIDYTLEQVINPQEWDKINRLTTYKTNIPTHYHIRNKKIYLYPTPSTDDYVITIYYLKSPKDMQVENYSTGTIAVTNASANVTGTSTSWTNTQNAQAGSLINIVGEWYEILSVTDATHLVLTAPYQGVNDASTSYVIGDVPLVPEDFQSLLWIIYVEEYFARNKQMDKVQEWKSQRLELEKRLKESTANRSTTSNVWTYGGKIRVLDPNYFTILQNPT